MSLPRVWLITGASSGFGLAMTRLVLERGDIAVATLRKPEVLSDLATQYPREQLLVLKLDVSKQQDIIDAFAQTKAIFGRLNVVFNNAGFSVLGEVEGTPEDIARAMFEVDFWGAVAVTKEAVRFFREVNKPGVGGRIIQNSSEVGIAVMPAVGFYAAAKHAFEAISVGLVKEMDLRWNIKITIIEPGGFRTDVITRGLVETPIHPAYDNNSPSAVVRELALRNEASGDAEKAVKLLYRLVELPEPPLHLPLGKDSIAMLRDEIANLTGDINQYESWSNDLEL